MLIGADVNIENDKGDTALLVCVLFFLLFSKIDRFSLSGGQCKRSQNNSESIIEANKYWVRWCAIILLQSNTI